VQINYVSACKYLGFFFTLNFLQGIHLYSKQKKVKFMLLKFFRTTKLQVRDSMFLFDRMEAPILCYGYEISGFKRVYVLESIHLKFCRYILKMVSS